MTSQEPSVVRKESLFQSMPSSSTSGARYVLMVFDGSLGPGINQKKDCFLFKANSTRKIHYS